MSSQKSELTVNFYGVVGSIAAPRLLPEIRYKIRESLRSYIANIFEEALSKGEVALPIENKKQLKQWLDTVEQKMSAHLKSWIQSQPIGTTGTYGGNTPCVLVETPSSTVILDAGTGMRICGLDLLKKEFGQGKGEALILLSHTHFDHVLGWPFFIPAYIKGNRFAIWGPALKDWVYQKTLKEVFDSIMIRHYFPVFLSEMGATSEFQDVEPGNYEYKDVRIAVMPMQHPVLCYGYRLEHKGKVIVYETDTEPLSIELMQQENTITEKSDFVLQHIENFNRQAVQLARDADIFICDAQYTPEEHKAKIGWGHCSYEHAVERAKDAGAKKLFLFHHEPEHTDKFLDKKTARARTYAKKIGYEGEIESAYEGLTISL